MVGAAPKNGLAIKTGKSRTLLSINAAKVLKANASLAKTTKAALERAAKAPPEAAMQLEVFKNAAIIASSYTFSPSTKNKNAFTTLFTACDDVDMTDAAKQMRKLAKENPTAPFYAKIATVRNGTKYTMTINFKASGRSKRIFASTIVINIRGKMHFIECAPVKTAQEAIANLRFTVKSLAKAAGRDF